jgi:DNA-binding NarL/FixJ family response regulator
MRARLSRDEEKEILVLAGEGLFLREIAAKTRRSIAVIHKVLKNAGIRRQEDHRNWTRQEEETALQMRLAGSTYRDIARRFQRREGTVRLYVKDLEKAHRAIKKPMRFASLPESFIKPPTLAQLMAGRA